jgi:hypothetical protein
MSARIFCDNCLWEYILSSDEYEQHSQGLQGFRTTDQTPSITEIRRYNCTPSCLEQNSVSIRIHRNPIRTRRFKQSELPDGKQPQLAPVD